VRDLSHPRASSVRLAHSPERLLECVYATAPMVVYILEAPTAHSAAVGVVVNAPSPLRLRRRDWMRALQCPGERSVFAANRVLYGGDSDLSALTMLHPYATLPSARPVGGATVHEGGYLLDAAQLVRSGRARADDFLFFRGRVTLAHQTLDASLAAGEWIHLPMREDESTDAARAAATHATATAATHATATAATHATATAATHATHATAANGSPAADQTPQASDDSEGLGPWAPNRAALSTLATAAGRASYSWNTWSQLVRRCSPSLAAALLRLRPDVLHHLIVQAAHLPQAALAAADDALAPPAHEEQALRR
jgi:hypothetical protein